MQILVIAKVIDSAINYFLKVFPYYIIMVCY